MALIAGTLIDGRYRIVRKLGEGGMGEVYEAEATPAELARFGGSASQRVALKVVARPAILANSRSMRRFAREGRVAASMTTRHVVRVLDVGRDGPSGAPFLAMELLEGEDLQKLLRRAGPLPPPVAVRIAAQACAGLVEAHALGVMHRDVKPANIFLSRATDSEDVIVKLLDFGIAKLALAEPHTAGVTSMTESGGILGSPAYMSPEQAKGLKSADHRTDIWSLGIVLYQALAGFTPFAHVETLGQLILAICSEAITPLAHAAPWVPAPIVAIVARAVERDATKRFASAQDMLSALAAVSAGETRLRAADLAGMNPGRRWHAGPEVSRVAGPIRTALKALGGCTATETSGVGHEASGERDGAAAVLARIDGLRLVSWGADHRVGTWGSIFVVIWTGPVQVTSAKMIRARLPAFASALPGRRAMLFTVVADGTPLPASDARDALADILRYCGSDLIASGVAIEGAGFRASAVRSVAIGLSLLARQNVPHRVFATIAEGAAWAETQLRAQGSSDAADGIVAAVGALRGGDPSVLARHDARSG